MHCTFRLKILNYLTIQFWTKIRQWTMWFKKKIYSLIWFEWTNFICFQSTAVLPLNWLTKVAKSTIFLLSLTLVTFHNCIARKFNHIPFFMFGPQFFLSCHLLLMLFSLTGFLFRHFDWTILIEIVKKSLTWTI